jgi:hypothetical protein
MAGMTRMKRERDLREEVLAVLRSSPNPQTCKKFCKADIFKFVEHLNEGRCHQCLAFFRMLDKEDQMMQFCERAGTENSLWPRQESVPHKVHHRDPALKCPVFRKKQIVKLQRHRPGFEFSFVTESQDRSCGVEAPGSTECPARDSSKHNLVRSALSARLIRMVCARKWLELHSPHFS